MKKAFFIFLFVLKLQLIHSQCINAPGFEGINSIVAGIDEIKLLSQCVLISIAFNKNYDLYNRYGLNSLSEKQSFKILKHKQQVSLPLKSESNEIKVKMNGLLERTKIDFQFKHSFVTKQSLIILFAPIGRNKWPFGRT